MEKSNNIMDSQEFEVIESSNSLSSFVVIEKPNNSKVGSFIDIDNLLFEEQRSTQHSFLERVSSTKQELSINSDDFKNFKGAIMKSIEKRKSKISDQNLRFEEILNKSLENDDYKSICRCLGHENYMIALAYLELKNYENAKDYLDSTVKFFKFSQDTDEVSNALDALTFVSIKVGSFKSGLKYCEESIEIKQNHVGNESFHLGLARFERAKVLDSLGERNTAIAEALLSKQILQQYERAKVTVIMIDLFLAQKNLEEDRLEQAEEIMGKSIKSEIDFLIEHKFDIVVDYEILEAIILYRKSNLTQAKQILEKLRVQEFQKTSQSITRIHTILKTLAKIYIKSNNHRTALEMVEQANNIMKSNIDKYKLASTKLWMSEVYSAFRRHDESTELILSAIDIYTQENQNSHLLGQAYHALGNAYLNGNMLQQSKGAYLQCIEIEKNIRCEDHPCLIPTYKALGIVMLMLNEQKPGIFYLEIAYKISKHFYGPRNSGTQLLNKMIQNTQKIAEALQKNSS